LLLRGCHSILHRFGWISHRLSALLGEIPSQPSEVLEKVGTPRDEEFAQALHDIPEEKFPYVVPLFQCLIAASRRLKLKELADISKELDPNADYSHEDAVLSACPALIARDPNDPTIVQFSHKSVKEFLISNRLRTSSIENTPRSRFFLKDAHATLARVCIDVLLRFDETANQTQLESSPLALYAAQYWVEHTQEGDAATKNQGVMERLFDPSKSHLKAWIWMHDVDKGQSRTMENLAEPPSSHIPTPLYYAALCGFTELVKHLADLCPDDLRDSLGHHGTPLHAASYKGHNEAVGALLAIIGSDLEKVNKKVKDKTPLHAAYYGRKLKTMDMLLDKGADADATGTLGNTLLHCASLDGQVEVIDLLLKYEANINAKNENGWTPLHRATLRGQAKVAEFLLNWKSKNENDENPKALVDAQSHDKNTPLHVASIIGNLQIVELLLGHNADTEIEGEHEWTPLEAADENRHKKIVDRLSRDSDPWWGPWGGSELDELRRRGLEKLRNLRRYAHTGSG
jgi:ankyrin repeat protein